jgi:hypothetical protein
MKSPAAVLEFLHAGLDKNSHAEANGHIFANVTLMREHAKQEGLVGNLILSVLREKLLANKIEL